MDYGLIIYKPESRQRKFKVFLKHKKIKHTVQISVNTRHTSRHTKYTNKARYSQYIVTVWCAVSGSSVCFSSVVFACIFKLYAVLLIGFSTTRGLLLLLQGFAGMSLE